MGVFVGRARELELLDQLGSQALVTIVGPPGVGKTRLAQEHRARLDRAIVIDLSDATDVQDICARVASSLGFMLPSIKAEASDEIGERLAARPGIVVVLDNFEQLVDCADDTVARWVLMAPDARFVVTSRVRLGIEAERVVELEPLPLPRGDASSDATELFVQRAERVRPDLDIGPRERACIADICRSLDGLPLALELAAARLAVLDAAQLRDRVRESLALVSGGQTPRHRSLTAAIELSWSGLSASAQKVLAQCSVFRGGFTAEAAEAVVRLDEPDTLVLDALQELQRCSLLSVGDAEVVGLRCSMLMSVRGFAASKLVEPGADLLRRHSAYYAAQGRARALRVERRGDAEAAAWLDAERENLRAVYERALDANDHELALECLLALEPVLRSHDARMLPMLSGAIERAREAGIDGPITIRARLLLGDHLLSRGRTDDSGTVLEGVLAELSPQHHPHLHADCLFRLGTLHINREQFARGLELYEQAIAAAQSCGNRVIEARAITRLAAIAGMQGKHAECEAHYRKALGMLREEGDQLWLGRTHYWMGILFLGMREYAEARHYLQQAAQMLSDARDYRFHAGVLLELGIAAQEEGDYDEAISRYSRATSALRDCGERRGVCEVLGFWASCFFEAGDLDNARAHFDESISIGRQIGHDRHVGLFSGFLAGLDATEGHVEAARIGFDTAEKLLLELDAPDWYQTVVLLRAIELVEQAQVAAKRDEPEAAELVLGRVRERLERARQPRDDRPALLDVSSEARISARIVERALLRSSALARDADGDSVSGSALIVTLSGAKLRVPGQGWTSLPKRSPLRRLLNALVTRREQKPGSPVPLEELVAAGWPDEKMLPDAARNRAYMALSRLRKLGLKPLIQRSNAGYWLDTDIELIRIPEFE